MKNRSKSEAKEAKRWGKRLSAVRQYFEWTQDEYGRRVGYSYSWVSLIESGHLCAPRTVKLDISKLERRVVAEKKKLEHSPPVQT